MSNGVCSDSFREINYSVSSHLACFCSFALSLNSKLLSVQVSNSILVALVRSPALQRRFRIQINLKDPPLTLLIDFAQIGFLLTSVKFRNFLLESQLIFHHMFAVETSVSFISIEVGTGHWQTCPIIHYIFK